MVGWHHQLNGHEFDQVPGDGEGQQSLACCNPWGRKELEVTQRLNNSPTTHPLTIQWLFMYFQNCMSVTTIALRILSSTQKQPCPPSYHPPAPSRPRPGRSLVCFVSMDLPILHVLCQLNHTLFCDWLLSLNVFKVHSCCGQCQYFISFICQQYSMYF